MCVVCIMLDKDKMTRGEAMKALWEQINSATTKQEETHIRELYAELEAGSNDQEFDID